MSRIVILAGASGNLGSGVLNCLLSKKYDHFIVFLREGKTLSLNDDRISFIYTGDFCIENNVKSAFEKINPDKNNIYYLFCSVGGYIGGKPLWEYTAEDLDAILRLNIYTTFLICKYFALLIQQSQSGAICLTSALTSVKPELNKSIYGLAKSALNTMIKTLAIEGRAINLSANVIAPYIIDSPENREWVKDSSVLIKPEEIGELVHSLFEDYQIISGNIVELHQKLRF